MTKPAKSSMPPEVVSALQELACADDVSTGLRALERAWATLGADLGPYRPLLETMLRRVSEVHRLRRLAGLDELTGIANRRAFHEAAQRELVRRQRSGSPLSLIMLDLDGLKVLNDSCGHAAGDAAIVAAARAFAGALRGSDVLARFGGDEFAVLLPETDAAGARFVADRLRQALELEVVAGHALRTSVGLATLEGAGGELRLLLAEADAALYGEKRTRKTGEVQRVAPAMNGEAA
ncbi:MAG: GGDEF domain-containing protein [Myxococcota bacterium]